LAERNIFLRERAARRSGNASRRSAPSAAADAGPRSPEQTFVLTGIALQEGRTVAFIENTATGTTERLLPDDPVARGRVARVELDFLDYEVDGNVTRIAIGQNLAGEMAAAPSVATASSAGSKPGPAATGPTTSPAGTTQAIGDAATPGGQPGAEGAAPADASLSAVEQMMRLRRLQQSGSPPPPPESPQ
jgi:hypothetical protein